jgi:hypothetical protein
MPWYCAKSTPSTCTQRSLQIAEVSITAESCLSVQGNPKLEVEVYPVVCLPPVEAALAGDAGTVAAPPSDPLPAAGRAGSVTSM